MRLQGALNFSAGPDFNDLSVDIPLDQARNTEFSPLNSASNAAREADRQCVFACQVTLDFPGNQHIPRHAECAF